MKIAIIGSINADIVINVREFAAPNETVISEQDYVLSDGGKGANQAAAVAAAGAEASFIARIGDDELGNRAIANLVHAGVNCEFVSRTPHAATGLAAILVNRHGECRRPFDVLCTAPVGSPRAQKPPDYRGSQKQAATNRQTRGRTQNPQRRWAQPLAGMRRFWPG